MIEFASAFPCNIFLAYPASGCDIGLVLQSFCQVMWMWILYIVDLSFNSTRVLRLFPLMFTYQNGSVYIQFVKYLFVHVPHEMLSFPS
jgi:hypothetical protein